MVLLFDTDNSAARPRALKISLLGSSFYLVEVMLALGQLFPPGQCLELNIIHFPFDSNEFATTRAEGKPLMYPGVHVPHQQLDCVYL
mmetsp:Transcript_3450/g.5899  ORF Transcript_3450/g.5899 Transcript_3450/m.5899 type:complete len:87 (+) Transcript_3450:518-778(+)